MRVLVTAGGTSEKMDEVRSITNHSTGQLGSLIAETFLQHQATVDYITTASAKRPEQQPNLQIFQIEDTQDLADTMSELLNKQPYDAVIHSMAVSDFTPAQSFSQETFLEKINQLLADKKQLTAEDLEELASIDKMTENKISSDTDQLILILKKTPKVIQQIKKIQPHTLLVGFKLLVDVSTEELFSVAKKSAEKSQADFILANDLTSIHQGQHTGYLLKNSGEIVDTASTKTAIAQLIVKTITHHL